MFFTCLLRKSKLILYCQRRQSYGKATEKRQVKILQKYYTYKPHVKMRILELEEVKLMRAILKGANVKQICKDLYNKGEIPTARDQTIWETLRGESNQFETLLAVVEEAKIRKEALHKKIKSRIASL